MTNSICSARLRLPAIAAPLFIISTPALLVEQCKAGIVGSMPALNARPGALLDEWLAQIAEELGRYDAENPDRPSAPFAINLIVHKSNDRLDRDLELCIKYKVPIVITSLGALKNVSDAIRSYGGFVLHDVISDAFARKAVEKGADGLVAVAAGAGGHAGSLSPFALISEIRSWFDGPLVLSGAIATGRGILAAQALGADFAYIGSAFIATVEANSSEEYRRCIVASRASDIVYTDFFTGVKGNYLRQSIESAGMDPDNLPSGSPAVMDFGSGGSQAAKPWRDIWGAGQGLAAVNEVVKAGELIARLEAEYREACDEFFKGRPAARPCGV